MLREGNLRLGGTHLNQAMCAKWICCGRLCLHRIYPRGYTRNCEQWLLGGGRGLW